MEEAIQCQSPNKIKELKAILISFSKPQPLWNKYKEYMEQDVLRRLQHVHGDMPFKDRIYNETLIIVYKVFPMVGKKQHDFGMINLCRVDRYDFDNEIA
ncbi:hypothetical protein TNIN_306601 [Trichonephila inaurata madagascariensis]|uniref:Uncharacterized protein n=1 Tax=Trichonephila inaurata madagascariensis TaxID=2747483 RepID=A0A8X6XXG3_9ARAC|nr:hypothetical protein TNIN_306601 [Trichonephila inaurata madagascariensis]